MKIRILGNSIRFRLTQTEVKDLAEKGKVEERSQFGPATDAILRYSLETNETNEITSFFANNHIQVFLPKKMTVQWANSEEVGIQKNIPLGDGESLYVLVEKDFKCLTDRDEDESDHFPNPAENC